MNDILGELGEKYKTLDKNSRLAIGEAIGGKTQINAVQALLGNWDQVLKFQQEYNQGLMVGSSDDENKRMTDSLHGRIVKLQEELKKLVTTTISSDISKSFVSGLTSVVSTVNSVISAFDKLGMSVPVALGTITSLFTTIKSLGTGQSIPTVFDMFKTAPKDIKDVQTQVLKTKNSFTSLAKGTTQYSGVLRSTESSSKRFSKALQSNGVVATQVNGKYNVVAKGTKSFATSMVASTAKTALATVGTTLLNGALMSLAGVGISLAIKGIDYLINKNEIAHDKIVQSMETTKAKINSLKTEKSELKNVASEYDKLTKKTKLNNEESARLAELKQQIAEISPDLVVGYDANNDPILALNGNLQDYIKGLDDAIKRQNELLKTQQNSAADKSLGSSKKYTSSNLDASFSGMGNVSHAYDDFTNPFNKDKLKSFQDGANRYTKILEERNEKVSDLNVKNTENYEKYRAIELEQQTKVINKLSEGSLYKNYNKLNEQTKNSMSTLIGNFDWESSVANTLQGQSQFIKGFDTLSSKIGENSEQVQNWNNKLIAANDAYQKTGDIESYKKSISGVTTELEKLTGISKEDWEIGFTQQLMGGLDETQIALNDFLKGYNKTIQDLSNQDPIAIKLKAEFESSQNLLSDLTAKGQTFESAVDLLVKVNKGEVDYGKLPYQMQTFLAGALDGGSKMSSDELQAFMKISTIISSQGELDDDTYGLITKMLNGELSQEEIEVGIKLPDGTTLNKSIVESINQANKSKDKNVKVGIESDLSKFKDDLSAIFGDNKDNKLKIETQVEKKDLDGLSKSLKELDEQTQVSVMTSILQNGQLTIPELEQVLNTLPPEVQSIIRTVLEETGLTEANTKLQNLPEYVSIIINTEMSNDGKVELDKMAEWLNGTDLSKRVQLDVVSNLANNDLDGLLATIENLDPKVQLEILSNSQSVLSTFGEIDNYKFTEKLIQLSLSNGDIESALAMFKQLDDNNKKIQIVTELVESGSLRIDELTEFIKLLPNEKQVDIITSLQKKGDLSPEEIQLLISGLPAEVQKKINVTTSGASQSKKELNEVDKGSKNQNKKVNVSEQGGSKVINTEKQVDNNSKNKDKKVKIAQTGGQSTLTLLDSINNKKLQDKKFTIKTVYETIKNTVTNFISGNKGGHSTQNLSEVAPLSDAPQDSGSPMTRETPQPTVSNQVSSRAVGSFGDIFTNPAQSTNINKSFNNVVEMIKRGINLFQELENRVSRTANQLDLLEVKMENAVGTEKINYLKTQNKLYENQIDLQKTLFNSFNEQRLAIKSSLSSQGFSFNEQGNLDNYEEKLLQLEQAYESAKNKESEYTGDNESTKKSLSNATEKANDKLSDSKKLTEEYIDLMYKKIPQAEQEWFNLQNSIKATNDEVEKLEFENEIYRQKNALEELNNSLEQYKNYSASANTLAQRYSGNNKIKYMKEESQYLQKQIDLTREWIIQQKLQENAYASKLIKFGSDFGFDGQITNYDEVLNKYQNSSDLDKVKEYMDGYIGLINEERDAVNSIEDLINSMQDLNNEIKKLQLEETLSPFNVIMDQYNAKIKTLQNNLSVIDIKMNNAYGTEKLNLIQKQVSLYKQLAIEQENMLSNLRQEEEILQRELIQGGFDFNTNGEIINMQYALDKIKNSDAYDYMSSVLEQWKELYETDIPNATNSIEDFKNSIKDAYKEQLNITQDIEDKIKNIYEKQLEDKKKLIQKETEAITKSLEAQKKAYKDMRTEVDYNNDYNEKTNDISELERKLEIARKDTSLGNKKKIADLEKQLSDARKDLDDFVQNKIDQDVEDNFDNAINSIEESNDKKLEELEEYWSDSKIAQMISQSLQTGLFEGIDGTITNLQDAMLNFAKTSGETFGVMGNVVKEELIANLGVALDTLKNYSDIMNNLSLDKINTTFSTGTMSSRSINTGDISINISTAANVNEQDIANKVKDAINQALEGAIQGL